MHLASTIKNLITTQASPNKTLPSNWLSPSLKLAFIFKTPMQLRMEGSIKVESPKLRKRKMLIMDKTAAKIYKTNKFRGLSWPNLTLKIPHKTWASFLQNLRLQSTSRHKLKMLTISQVNLNKSNQTQDNIFTNLPTEMPTIQELSLTYLPKRLILKP